MCPCPLVGYILTIILLSGRLAENPQVNLQQHLIKEISCVVNLTPGVRFILRGCERQVRELDVFGENEDVGLVVLH